MMRKMPALLLLLIVALCVDHFMLNGRYRGEAWHQAEGFGASVRRHVHQLTRKLDILDIGG